MPIPNSARERPAEASERGVEQLQNWSDRCSWGCMIFEHESVCVITIKLSEKNYETHISRLRTI